MASPFSTSHVRPVFRVGVGVGVRVVSCRPGYVGRVRASQHWNETNLSISCCPIVLTRLPLLNLLKNSHWNWNKTNLSISCCNLPSQSNSPISNHTPPNSNSNDPYTCFPEGDDSSFAITSFIIGLCVSTKHQFDKIWLRWLISQADANPTHTSAQFSLLAELNKHSPEAVIKRFKRKDIAVDGRGVVEYLRALVSTHAIVEYLPDEQSGKQSALPALLIELKQRASRNMEELSLNPRIFEKNSPHVVKVHQKVSNNSSHLARNIFSTVLFTIAVGLVWIMGASALQKYFNNFGNLGGGVGLSSSYTTTDLGLEVIPDKDVKTFNDIKGCDNAKQELKDVVQYLKHPSKFSRLQGELPKGILLTGEPGTGKTLLAKATAGEAGVPFFFEEKYLFLDAERVKLLFQEARKKAPCVIFIVGIDDLEGHADSETLHQLGVEIDDLKQNEGIILMAATKLPKILHPSLIEPSRFGRHIIIPSPDVRDRQEILELYLYNKPLNENVDVKAIARGTPGFSGADLKRLVNTAAIKAGVDGAENITADHLESAKNEVRMYAKQI